MRKKIKFKGKEFFGAGVVVYHGKMVLLQKVKGRNFWEDFGGRTDSRDENIIETAFRECSEESNNILNKDFLNLQLKNNKNKCYYILNDNKYFVYMIYVSRKDKKLLDSSLFGKKETHDGIERKVDWVTKDDNLILHNRLGKLK